MSPTLTVTFAVPFAFGVILPWPSTVNTAGLSTENVAEVKGLTLSSPLVVPWAVIVAASPKANLPSVTSNSLTLVVVPVIAVTVFAYSSTVAVTRSDVATTLPSLSLISTSNWNLVPASTATNLPSADFAVFSPNTSADALKLAL